MLIIQEFSGGRTLTKNDVGFINSIGEGDHSRGVSSASATFNSKTYKAGMKITDAEATAINDAALARFREKNVEQNKSRDMPCAWCAAHCRWYEYYWYNGYCWCYACY